MLANPKKLRVIAESTKKTDRLDAQVLAEFLARDMIPEAYRPTPRQRQHRTLVRHRQYLRGRMTSVKNKIRRIAGRLQRRPQGPVHRRLRQGYFKDVTLSDADRFVLDQLWSQWEDHQGQLRALAKQLKAFAAKAPAREAEARPELKTTPGVGPVTADVVVSELGDVSRFH